MNNNLNAIRALGIDAINKANSGHPGIVLGAAPITFALYTKIMNIDPKNSKWFNRDRFILSAGHGSALLYSVLHLSGFKVSINDLKNFRQWGSKTPGHPELGITDGVEVTTGPLGQGIAMGVGMAVAEKSLAARYNQPNYEIIDHYTYVLCGDGDLQEGVANEAISFAGKNQLNKLILLHDSNDVQLDDYVKTTQTENLTQKFQAANWNTIFVDDGEDVDAIVKAIKKAQISDKPTYIEVKTVIGLGATKQGTPAVHGAPLGSDIDRVKNYFEWKEEPFVIPNSVYKFYERTVQKRGEKAFHKWTKKFEGYQKKYPTEYKELTSAIDQKWSWNLDEIINNIPSGPQATRVSSGSILNNLTSQIPNMIGGSADLASSTKIAGPDGQFSPENPAGRNLMYGVREFAMTAINNGMVAHGGLLPFASGFFVFADYMKPALRLASMMKLQQLFIFTHDSVAVGEDGPTHEPIEQLAMLRSIPNMVLFRPADYQETYAAYNWALENKTNPTTIVLSRQNLPELNHKQVLKEVNKGAYIIDDNKQATLTLIATGSEVSLAIEAKKILEEKGLKVRVVSMVSREVFAQQSKKYQQTIIDQKTIRISIEMGATYGWEKFTGDQGLNIGIDHFGESAPGETIIENFGFTPEKISKRILAFVKEAKK